MRSEFDRRVWWTDGEPEGKGRPGALLVAGGHRISDERFQSAVLGHLVRDAAKRIGKSLHLELHRRAPVA